MAADNFTATLSLQYTPPGGPPNSGVASLAVQGTYQGGQAGSIDIPPGTVVSTVIPVPFGSVDAAKVLVIRNNSSAEIGVRLNSSVANILSIPPGGEFAFLSPVAPGTTPLISASIVTGLDPTSTERVLFWVFGD